MSKWLTPLEGIKSGCLNVTHSGKNIPYDGIQISRRFPPSSTSYIKIPRKGSVSTKFDLSKSFNLNKLGDYVVSVNIVPLYYRTRPFNEENTGRMSIMSPGVHFTITEVAYRHTDGGVKIDEVNKSNVTLNSLILNEPSQNRPKQPRFQGPNVTEEIKQLISDVHIAVFHYLEASLLESDNPEAKNHLITWFGNDMQVQHAVYENYKQMILHLKQTVITYYIFNKTECKERSTETLAYTYRFTNTIYFCPKLFEDYHKNVILPIATDKGLYSISTVIIRELSHAIVGTFGFVYGETESKELAKKNPGKALANGFNYQCFSGTTYPFDYGIYAMTVFPVDKILITKGNIVAQLTGTVDAFHMVQGYPKLIRKVFGTLTGKFVEGFDSLFHCDNDMKRYATKDSEYVRFTGMSPDIGFPKSIKGNFGNLPQEFFNGFDSAARLPNLRFYVTKGNKYAIYDNNSCSSVEYVKSIAGNWGSIPSSFEEGFDAMMSYQKKTYVVKGRQYVRYNDPRATKVDPGYPKSIRGNFGKVAESYYSFV